MSLLTDTSRCVSSAFSLSFCTRSLKSYNWWVLAIVLRAPTWRVVPLSTTMFARRSATLLPLWRVCLMVTSLWMSIYCSICSSLSANLQLLPTLCAGVPYKIWLIMLIKIWESHSIMSGKNLLFRSRRSPCQIHSNSSELFVSQPIDPMNVLRTLPLRFLNIPPNPALPRFAFDAPSKLSSIMCGGGGFPLSRGRDFP